MASKTKSKSKVCKKTKNKARAKVVKQNVGIDISKDDFKVCLYQRLEDQTKRIKASKSFKNTLAGFTAFVEWVMKKRATEVELNFTIEATGVYYEQLTYFLTDNSFSVSVVLPNKSKAYADSLNLKTRTDKTEAQMLGQMGLERDLDKWQAPSANIRTLKQLTRDRVNLLEEKTALKNKEHALDHSHQPDTRVLKRINQRIKLVEKQIKQVEKEISQLIQKDALLEKKILNICQAKGLAELTVATVIAETNGFTLFTAREQVVSYAGYDITFKESGSSVKTKGRISKKGNRYIRRALYFPAFTIIKYEENFKQLYDRVYDRTKIKMKAGVAVQRKILLLIYALYKNDQPYDPNYYKTHLPKETKEEIVPKETIQSR